MQSGRIAVPMACGSGYYAPGGGRRQVRLASLVLTLGGGGLVGALSLGCGVGLAIGGNAGIGFSSDWGAMGIRDRAAGPLV